MKKWLSILLLAMLVACDQKQTLTDSMSDATGKGNGGNGLTMSGQEIKDEFGQVKPALQLILQGIQAQYQAEKLSPGISDLSGKTQIMGALKLMFDNNADHVKTFDAFDDLQSPLQLQDAPCVDAVGAENAAGTLLLQPKTAICFSLSVIQAESPAGGNDALEVLLLSLASHEMVHHFVSYGTTRAADEQIAIDVQAYVASELERAQVVEDGVIVLDEPFAFASRFNASAQATLAAAKTNVPSPYQEAK